jgi:hypothetical protein
MEPGQTPYASSCPLTIPAGSLPSSTTVNFVYEQETSIAGSPPNPGHKQAFSIDIDVNTN